MGNKTGCCFKSRCLLMLGRKEKKKTKKTRRGLNHLRALGLGLRGRRRVASEARGGVRGELELELRRRHGRRSEGARKSRLGCAVRDGSTRQLDLRLADSLRLRLLQRHLLLHRHAALESNVRLNIVAEAVLLRELEELAPLLGRHVLEAEVGTARGCLRLLLLSGNEADSRKALLRGSVERDTVRNTGDAGGHERLAVDDDGAVDNLRRALPGGSGSSEEVLLLLRGEGG